MANEIDYEVLVQDALRNVVRDVLAQTVRVGLPGDHHFYIAFQTDYMGVDIPDYLREEFPDEITIVLQHEYWDLEVEADRFAITLCFNDVNERLLVPFGAITSFVDPSVKFGLQFSPAPEEKAAPKTISADRDPKKEKVRETEKVDGKADDGSNVVTLDTFRKKD